MEILWTLLTLPYAPVRGLTSVLRVVAREAEARQTNPVNIRRELEELDRAAAAGEITAAERDAGQQQVLDRLTGTAGGAPRTAATTAGGTSAGRATAGGTTGGRTNSGRAPEGRTAEGRAAAGRAAAGRNAGGRTNSGPTGGGRSAGDRAPAGRAGGARAAGRRAAGGLPHGAGRDPDRRRRR
ncbi:gas vesicle protein GvpG [Micromonospora sp. NPDC000089]|uniref:gas vesicle protein GvpG n=1 Tax=unclassified Micromonospora TaxID=2617518 RepID=UPI0036B78A49